MAGMKAAAATKKLIVNKIRENELSGVSKLKLFKAGNLPGFNSKKSTL
jgi:hypothetical protein